MIIQSKVLLASIFTLVISMQAEAKPPSDEDRPERPERPSFSSLDTNEDGIIGFDEFSSKELPFGEHQEVFDNIDADGDGEISQEEFESHKPKHTKGSKGKRRD